MTSTRTNREIRPIAEVLATVLGVAAGFWMPRFPFRRHSGSRLCGWNLNVTMDGCGDQRWTPKDASERDQKVRKMMLKVLYSILYYGL